FPYWSFLFADLHPHLIGIPLAVLFVGALFSLIAQYGEIGSKVTWRGIALGLAIAFLLGTIISNNLWDLPTYFGIAILAFLICEYRYSGRIRVIRVAVMSVILLATALVLYLPFFTHFVNVGASGLGVIHDGDDLGLWLLLWAGLGFIVVSWLLWSVYKAGVRRQSLNVEIGSTSPAASAIPQAEAALPLVETSAIADTAETPSLAQNHEHPESPQSDPTARPRPRLGLGEGPPAAIEPVASEQVKIADERGGVARLLGMSMRHFERLPRLFYLHQRLVQRPTLS